MIKFMEGFTEKITKKQMRITILAVISFFLFLILQIISVYLKNSLDTQQMALRWDDTKKSAQVSCFISENTEVTTKQLINLEHAVDAALADLSITTDNQNARLWADAYSARGEVTVESSKTSITSTAIGIGGDFFLFHPLQLLDGSYFSDEDLMQDYIVIDEDAAWQLFGSNDVEGMKVTIKGIPHTVRGVIKRGAGRMNDKAGNDKVTFYISYDSLSKYGTSKGINAYEIVMPNPISGFALSTIADKIGIEKENMQLVENSKRYSLPALLTVISEFGIRSMNQKAIVYPYWENVARGYEDILALMLLGKFIFLIIPIIVLIAYGIYRFKHRTWNMKSIYHASLDLKEKFILKYHDRKKEKTTYHVKRRNIKEFFKNNIDKTKKWK